MIIKQPKNLFPLVISVLTLITGGLGIVFANAMLPIPRTMVPQFPYLIAFLFFFVSLFIKNKSIHVGLILLVCFFGLKQYKAASNLLFSEQMVFEEDSRKMLEIDMAVKNLQLENASRYKLIIISTSAPQNSFHLSVEGDLIGTSLFTFGSSDMDGPFYINDNIVTSMASQGMKYEAPTKEEYLDIWRNKTNLRDSKVDFATEVIDNFIVINIR